MRLGLINFDALRASIKISAAATELFQLNNIRTEVFETETIQQFRQVCNVYKLGCGFDAIVLIIDSADDQVKTELDDMLADEEIADVPLLIMGNNIDTLHAKNEELVVRRLNLSDQLTGVSLMTEFMTIVLFCFVFY